MHAACFYRVHVYALSRAVVYRMAPQGVVPVVSPSSPARV